MGNTNPTPFTGKDGNQYVAVLAGVDGSGNADALKTNGSGVLLTSVSGAGSGGTSATDDAAFTAATDAGTPMMGFASSDTVDAGDVGVVGMTTDRHLKINIASSDVAIGGGTEYTEGDTDASITGGAILWEDTSDTLRAVSAAKPLPIDVKNASVAVTAASLPLPSGASTSANQTTANGLLTTIAGAVAGTEVQVDVLTMPTTTVQATNLDIRDLSSASDTVTVHGDVGVLDQFDLTSSNPAAVAIVDGNGDQITSFGGGTQYTEGDTDASITGNAMLFETNTGTNTLGVVSASNPLPISDNSGSITVDNGGTFAVQAAQSGTWNVTNVSGTVSLPTGASTLAEQQTQTTSLQLLDDGVFTDDTSTHSTGASKGYGVMAVATPTHSSVNANDFGHVAMTTDRKLHVSVKDALPAGTNAIGKLATNDGVDIGDVTINNASIAVTQGTATNLKAQAEVYQGGVAVSSGAPLQVTLANGTVPSHAVTNAGTFAVQDSEKVADNAGFTDGTTKVQPVGYIYDEVAGTALTENDAAAARINVNRAQVHAIEDGSTRGRYATVTAANALKVDASEVAVPVTDNSSSLSVDWNGTQPVTGSGTSTGALRVELANNGTGLLTANPGTAANWGIYVEDAAETAGANLVMAGAVRRDTAASSSGTSGDNSTINVDALGKLWTTGSYAEDSGHTTADTLVAVATRRIDTAASSAGTSADYATLDTSAEGAVWSTLTPTTTSGCSVFMATSADGSTALTNTAQAIKASAGNLYGYYIGNPNSSAVYVHLYNTAAASVTVGTTNPLVTFYIPGSAAANLTFPYPITFSNAGWSCSATTTGGGNTAPGTAIEAVFFYK